MVETIEISVCQHRCSLQSENVGQLAREKSSSFTDIQLTFIARDATNDGGSARKRARNYRVRTEKCTYVATRLSKKMFPPRPFLFEGTMH